ncbi:unnamed protein product [Paramecium sonneborni]|uniref:H-type lectin domain-containing protein n=1 Tax=Paramecium sonneborni TaxID=65129 RepID=A0A8S1RQD4_9CILI|nr:unnamed protein product [Paramecium sonneborni]
MLILYLLIQKANSLSEYQFGVQILDCQKSSVQINFPKQFEQTPQIIITQSEMYSLRNGINFRFEIGSITTKSYPLIKNLGFTIYQGCLQNIKQVNIKWYAIDDQIIQVIDCYNRDDPKNETFNHNNLNALNGFLTLTSFYYISSVSFNIDVFLCIFEIIEITPFNVTVGISKTDSLKQIGYQIILGANIALFRMYKQLFLNSQINFLLVLSQVLIQHQMMLYKLFNLKMKQVILENQFIKYMNYQEMFYIVKMFISESGYPKHLRPLNLQHINQFRQFKKAMQIKTSSNLLFKLSLLRRIQYLRKVEIIEYSQISQPNLLMYSFN